MVNASTVGQKAGRIKVWLEMDFLYEKYLFSDSPVRSFIDRLVVTEDGFIVPADWLEEDEDEEENDDEDEKLEDYKIVEKGRILMNFYGRPRKVLEFRVSSHLCYGSWAGRLNFISFLNNLFRSSILRIKNIFTFTPQTKKTKTI